MLLRPSNFEPARMSGELLSQSSTSKNRRCAHLSPRYPADPRSVDARLRLAHLLAVRSDLQNTPNAFKEALQLLEAMENDPTIPSERRPDAAFATLSLKMRRLVDPSDTQRDEIVSEARQFEHKYPGDRRLAPLFAELAGLYDSRPVTKKSLLDEALRNNPNEAVSGRISDDLKRLALLGRPVPLKFTSIQGEAVNSHSFEGKVVLVYFFASWSPQSITGLGVVKEVLGQFSNSEVQPLGVSLDVNRPTLMAALSTYKIAWPICYEGKGWQGPLVRSLGINAVPTVWIFDRKGNLRTLSARDEAEGIIRGLLREP